MAFADFARKHIPRHGPARTVSNKPFDITTDLKPGDVVRWDNERNGTFLRYEMKPGYGLCIWYLRPDFMGPQLSEGFDEVHRFTLVSRA